jgi:hypothetical protein
VVTVGYLRNAERERLRDVVGELKELKKGEEGK